MTREQLQTTLTAALPKLLSYHTLILYGSWARGQQTDASDVDLFCLGESGEAHRVAQRYEGYLLDLWYYPEDECPPASQLLHLADGIVLAQREQRAESLLQQVQESLNTPPKAVPEWEREVNRQWFQKTLRRCQQASTPVESQLKDVDVVEAHFRRHWVLSESLSMWFAKHQRHYPGPKMAIRYLQAQEPSVYNALQAAMTPGASLDAIERWLAMCGE